ncbi:hypothetical protein F5B20DRAFT_587050 [Whalleya microplaca]|nr:hypothetical protein F5B20DRAFT_587050 [Whalleya microplaca]
MRVLSVASIGLFALTPSLTTAAPTDTLEKLDTRGGFDWHKCEGMPKGSCTIYMATGTAKSGYRTAGLFDHNCKLTQAVTTTKLNKKITLKGHLPLYVDLYVDDYIRPRGWLSYDSSDTELGDKMACHEYPNTDGVACRKAFQCS